ncbi:hypothetical protein, partial [Thalassoglobus neptunius]|uniref:hypothetical protein n=1 Tax=Thalassoglobus neptunius TaxID=1938619 RepID=UPI001E48001C
SKSLPSHRKQLPALQNKHDLTQWQPTKTQTATQKSAMFNGLLAGRLSIVAPAISMPGANRHA